MLDLSKISNTGNKFSHVIISYITEYIIARKIIKIINCKDCSVACVSSNIDNWSNSLLGVKNKRGLTRPSHVLFSYAKLLKQFFSCTRIIRFKKIQ